MATSCTEAIRQRRRLSWPMQVLIALAVTAALAVLSYLFVDRPVSLFITDRGINHCSFLNWLTRPPEVFITLSPFILFASLLKRRFAPWTWPEKCAAAAAVSTLLTALAALVLKIAFGRAGPYLLDRLSPANGGVYGFYPFNVAPAYWAFPSGHTACTASVTSVVQAAFPRQRLFWWSGVAMVAAALVALNYHFVGDVFAGAFVGWAVGGTTSRWFGFTGAYLEGAAFGSARVKSTSVR